MSEDEDKIDETMRESIEHKEAEGLDLEPLARVRPEDVRGQMTYTQAQWDAFTPEERHAEELATANWRAEMAQRREGFLEDKWKEEKEKALMLQVEVTKLKAEIEKLKWHNADLQERNDGQYEALKERDDQMLKDVLFAELKSNVAFYKEECEKRGKLLELIFAEEAKHADGRWIFTNTATGIRIKFPEPTQTMHLDTERLKDFISLLLKFLEKQVEKDKRGPLG
jgi:hypothetical protein